MSSSNIAIVTGSNKGLGFALVKELCKKFDGTIYLTSRDEKRGKESIEKLRKDGFIAVYHQLDVTDKNSIKKFCNHIKTKHNQVDIVINNAGILYPKDAKETKAYQAEQTILINFFGLVNFTEEILPLVKEGGTIVNISSSSGHLSRIPNEELRKKISCESLTLEELQEMMKRYLKAVKEGKDVEEGWGDSPYVVSKVAVNAYTFMLNRSLEKKDIRVSCIHPGYVQSDMTKGAGNITPDAAAANVLQYAMEPAGVYIWHDGTAVAWHGDDPRRFIDGMNAK